jgi:hypothetical protein
MEIKFKFVLDQSVKTPFGSTGIVSMMAFDDSGNTYYVKTETGGNWFKEAHLSSVVA